VPTVELEVPPSPAHVRTARLVAVAAARRAGLPEDLLDEVRLGVGEACARAVSVHLEQLSTAPVRVVVVDELGTLTVTVTDAGPPPDRWDAPPLDLLHRSPGDPRVPLAFLAGLVDDLSIGPEGSGTAVRLRWDLPRVAV
jgi:anti-sigma regulatory factor (Ser/Thr protein kinase)